jgi:hypothetical protein
MLEVATRALFSILNDIQKAVNYSLMGIHYLQSLIKYSFGDCSARIKTIKTRNRKSSTCWPGDANVPASVSLHSRLFSVLKRERQARLMRASECRTQSPECRVGGCRCIRTFSRCIKAFLTAITLSSLNHKNLIKSRRGGKKTARNTNSTVRGESERRDSGDVVMKNARCKRNQGTTKAMPLLALRCRYIKLIGRPFKRNRPIHNKKLRISLCEPICNCLKKKKLLVFAGVAREGRVRG